MEHNKTFTSAEANEIKSLLNVIRLSDRDTQKKLRGQLRNTFKFFISDFTKSKKGFTPSDFDNLMKSGKIIVQER